MRKLIAVLFLVNSFVLQGQVPERSDSDRRIQKLLVDPTQKEIENVLENLRQKDLSPKKVVLHDSIVLSNTNKLYVLSHLVDGNRHYGAVIVPMRGDLSKLPIIIFATGGDGMHTEFDIGQDFNHAAVQFPNFLGGGLDEEFIIVVPSFRGQELIIGEKRYLSEGNVGDAFDGATTDALAFLNVVLKKFMLADEDRISIFGGSRGGTVALLASSRDKRIKRTITVAAPTDMKALYELYPDQFKLLFFNDLFAGKISETEARRRFIASSPIYFTGQLPLVHLHHDINDPFVPIHFAKNLACEMIKNNRAVRTNFYQENIHGFWDDQKYWARVQDFIKKLVK